MEWNIPIVKDLLEILQNFLSIFFSHVKHNQNDVHLKIYDDDGAAGRDAIGSAKINLDHVKKSGNYDQWVKLPKLFGLGSNGQAHVRMTFHT